MLAKIDKGVIYMLLASASFAFMALFVKLLSPFMSPVEAAFFRNIFGVAFVLFSLLRSRPRHRGGKPFLLFMRGLLGTAGLMFYFYNIFSMPLADAMTFTKTSPIFVGIFAYFAYKERARGFTTLAIALGFFGVIFVVKPGFGVPAGLIATGLASGIFAALAYTTIKDLRKYYETRIIVLSFTLTGTLFPACFLFCFSDVAGDATGSTSPLFAPFVMPSALAWAYIIGLGFFGTLAQFLMTIAYGHSNVAVVGAVSYTDIFFAMIIGFFAGDALPDLLGFIGVCLIIAAGILASKK
ncbi:MAG: DMT family transporter [Helicobacteraceae bacterium]